MYISQLQCIADCHRTTQTAQAAQLTCQHNMLEEILFLSLEMTDLKKMKKNKIKIKNL